MYSATIRLVYRTKAECETELKNEHARLKKFGVVETGDFTSHDGTIQLSVEDLSKEKFQFTGDAIKTIVGKYDSLGDVMYYADDIAKEVNAGVDLAFNQGVLSAVRDKVTFPFKD